jgi:transcriptional regulator with GAF, ATPase, and Fis domain
MSGEKNLVPASSRTHLNLLQQRLAQVANSWAIDDYRAFVTFYARMLPKLMSVERCTIYILDIESKKICSIFGTGLAERQIEAPMEGSIVGSVISSGRSHVDNYMELHDGFHLYVAEQTGFTCRNMLCCPIRSLSGKGVIGAVQLINKSGGALFDDEDLHQLEEAAHYLSISIESIVLNQEILRIAGYLNSEVHRLGRTSVGGSLLIAESPAMREVLDLVRVVSEAPIHVLIQGENGTGKELVARMIHENSERGSNSFVPVNCACIPETLIESEFFGHERGAFSGADASRKGRFEEADGGTLFLDEIAEMPLQIQPKFLRAIQEGEGSRLGSNKIVSYDVRLISATNKDLAVEVKKGAFREDLFFRLFSVEIFIPPLRQRREDILPLAFHFLEETQKRFKRRVLGYSEDIIELFEQYSWPGNVRQLLKEVERLVALTPDGSLIQPGSCSRELTAFFDTTGKQGRMAGEIGGLVLDDQVRKVEISLIEKALKQAAGNKAKAARMLRISRQGLDKKLKRYNLCQRTEMTLPSTES